MAQAEKGLVDFVNVILSGRKKLSVVDGASPSTILEFLLKRLEYQNFLKKSLLDYE